MNVPSHCPCSHLKTLGYQVKGILPVSWLDQFFQSQGAHGGSPSLRQSHVCLNATTPKEYSGSAVPSPWVQCQERDHLYPYV